MPGGLRELVASVVAIADSVTGGETGLQSKVVWRAFLGHTKYNVAEYAEPINVDAFVLYKQTPVQSRTGQTIMSKATVIITRPLPIVTGATVTRTQPIDIRDQIILPNGTTGPIIDDEGFSNPDTTRPYTTKIMIGIEPSGRGSQT